MHRILSLLLVLASFTSVNVAHALDPIGTDGALYIKACPSSPTGACDSITNKSLGQAIDVLEIGVGSASVRVPINPKAPLPTPSGWTAPVFPSVNPSPPATGTLTTTFSNATFLGSQTFSSGPALCSALAAIGAAGGPTNGLFGVSWNGSTACVGPNGSAAASIANTCPTGYTFSAGVCGSPNALTVVKPPDNSCGVRRVANVYTNDAADTVDCAASPLAGSGTGFCA